MRVASWVLRGPLLLLLLGSVVFAYAQELPPDTASTTPATLEETPPPADEPLIQLAEAAPTSIVYVYDTSVSYPKRFPSSGDLQSALKDGDVFTITASAYSYGDTGYQQIDTVTADLSELGLGLAVPLSPQGQANQPLRYYFSAIDLILPPGVASGTKQLPITITDENGVQAIVTISILVDTVSPTLALSATVAPNTPLKPSYPLYWSGSMDGTGTPLRIYRIWQEQLAEDGTTVLSTQVLGPQNGDMTTFRDVVDGPLTNVPYYITDIGRSGMFTDGTAYLRFTFIAADGAGNQVTTASSLYPIHWDLLPTGTATTSPYTIVHDFPWAAWGDPSRWAGVNTPFRRRLSLYPLVGVSNAETGEWGTVGADFMNWYDQTQTRTFNRLEAYLGIGGVAGLARHPATSGNLYIKIFEANENGDRLSLLATSDALPASALVQLANPEDCTGYGFSFNPFTSGCIANFSFAQAVTLSVGVRYTFELTGEGIVTTPVSTNGTYYLPDLMMVGASRYSPPLWGLDGIQRGVNPNTGVVYMRLLDTGVVTPTTGASSVLFIPGFMASRLYTKENGNENKLWDTIHSAEIKKLKLASDGTSLLPIYTRDVIEALPLTLGLATIHKQLLEHLAVLKTEEKIDDWKAYPYDWRYDVFDVVDDGALKENGTREYLDDVVETLASTSKSGKVTIVAHSNGGLVAKALMVRLAEQGRTDLVDRIVLIGTPQLGTPKGYYGILHGRESALLGSIIGPASVMREVASTLPGAYGLVPSPEYFDTVTSPNLGTFGVGTTTLPYRNAFGSSLNSYAEALGHAINSPATRVQPATNTIGTPLIASSVMMNKAKQTHAVLDAWTPPAGVEVNEIAGLGNNTMAGGAYYERVLGYSCSDTTFVCGPVTILDYKPVWVENGDDTVVTPSAKLGSGGVYFDLEALSNLRANKEDRKHENLTESPFVHAYLNYLLGIAIDYNQNLFLAEEPTGTTNDIVISVHSPALLSVKDSVGNVTGIFPYSDASSDLWYKQEDIPGSTVSFGGEGKYIVLPKDGMYTVTVDGIGAGMFDLEVEEKNGPMIRAFKNIPVATSTIATTSVANGLVTTLAVDTNGDGRSDLTVQDTLTRKDALSICRSELGGVRSLIARLYLITLFNNLEKVLVDKGKSALVVAQVRAYLVVQVGKYIPSQQARAIATCLAALENSRK